MSELEIQKEIFQILEVKLQSRKINSKQIREYQERLTWLIDAFPAGARRDRVIQKIRDKQRFAYYINDTGILDFTGYGKHFW